jgi:hypothetical protein
MIRGISVVGASVKQVNLTPVSSYSALSTNPQAYLISAILLSVTLLISMSIKLH